MRTAAAPTAARSAAAATAALLAVLAVSPLLSGCSASDSGARPSQVSEVGPLSTVVTGPAGRAGRSAPEPARTTPAPARLPGLGPRTLAQVPAAARQAVLVTGAGADSSDAKVTLYTRDATAGWRPAGPVWTAHNALKGWTDTHHEGDLRSPIGVFGLSDAGGRLADPGAKLPYDHAPIGFTVHGTGFRGEPLRGAFDYVIAIDYNHVPGTSPRDWTRPLGASRGGGIWLHVDHGGPTQGCVSLPQQAMRTLLRTLDPKLHPVVVMGDAAALAR
ncbi:L,D-transpeptidase family protein [Actinacidiphila alni]|uniref:L,D-transpeptidase family protein n=1 Tax=Actinacidiphila alni TaxID=380248 RepID=UPI00340F8C85